MSSLFDLLSSECELTHTHSFSYSISVSVFTLRTPQSYSIIMSLPAVFLAYAIVAFVTGLVLYAFRGVVIVNTSHNRCRFH